MKNKYAIILLGCPGSGKTSIAQRLATYDQIEFIETGQLLREEVEKESDMGKKLKSYLQSGKLAPTKLVVQMVNKRIHQLNAKIIVFDGSPRRQEEIEPFSDMIESNGMSILKTIIFLIDRDVAFKRLTGRRICPKCGKIFNIYYNPPANDDVCDECRSHLEQRDDDKPEIVNRRIDEFENDTMPVIQYFRQNYSDKIIEIDAEKPIEKIFEKIRTELKEMIQF